MRARAAANGVASVIDENKELTRTTVVSTKDDDRVVAKSCPFQCTLHLADPGINRLDHPAERAPSPVGDLRALRQLQVLSRRLERVVRRRVREVQEARLLRCPAADDFHGLSCEQVRRVCVRLVVGLGVIEHVRPVVDVPVNRARINDLFGEVIMTTRVKPVELVETALQRAKARTAPIEAMVTGAMLVQHLFGSFWVVNAPLPDHVRAVTACSEFFGN